MEHRNFPRRASVTYDGVQLSYIRQGSGRPIVLLHGWSQCAEEFKHQIGPISAQYDVIAVDQRSHGESQKASYGVKDFPVSQRPVRAPNQARAESSRAVGSFDGIIGDLVLYRLVRPGTPVKA